MAITQVTTVTVDGVTIGLSDTIYNLIQAGEFTIANLQPFMIVGQKTVGEQYYASLSAAERNYTGSGGSTPEWFPVNNTGSLGPPTVEFQTKASVTLPHVSYGRNFLVHGTLEIGVEPQQIRADNMLNKDLRVVTSIDYKKIYYDVEMASAVYNFDSPAGSATYYQTGAQGCVRTIDNDEDAQCFVYSIFGDDSDWYCIKDWMFPADDSTNNSWHMSSSQGISGNYGDTYSSLGIGYTNFTTTKTMFRWIGNQVNAVYGGGSWDWNNSGHLVTVNGDIIQACDYSGSGVYAGGCYNIISGLDNALKQLANAGLKFKWNNTWYKPISDGGIVTGYTDDMTEESEWDDIVDVTGNTVPVTPTPPVPPTPSGDEDDIDSMGFDGMSCSVGGPAKYYIMPYSDIHHLIGDFNAHAEPGTSISNNIISCYVNALDWNWTTGSEPIEIYSGGAQTVAFTSDKNYSVITGYNARDIIGSIDVPRMTNTFYDFAPYSTYEVYVPFCGWVALPDTVAGRHIKIYFETDEATCGCKGRVFFVDDNGNGVTVAEITGSFGAPCPIQVIEGGLYKQAMLSNGLQVIGGVASGVMGGAMGAGALAVSGLSSAMQSLGNCLIAGNTNYGQTIGRAGDASGLMCAGKPYLKITYPPLDEVVNNSRFGHTVGYLCNTIGKLSTFSGFTVCANPHITGINCTDSEKEEIKRLLEEGVIL